MRLAAPVTGLAILLAAPAIAQPHVMKGAGVGTCGKFASEYRQSPDYFEQYYFAWAQGFMSGLNLHYMGGSVGMRDLNSRDFDHQQRFIRDFCDKNPLKMYMEAVRALFWSFPPVPKSTKP